MASVHSLRLPRCRRAVLVAAAARRLRLWFPYAYVRLGGLSRFVCTHVEHTPATLVHRSFHGFACSLYDFMDSH